MSPEPTRATGSPSSPASSPERSSATIRYIDRADMNETFADSITGLIFDCQMLRIELGVTRFDEMKPNAPITGPLSGRPSGAAAGRRHRSHQSYAADRGCADASRRGETGAAPSRRSAA